MSSRLRSLNSSKISFFAFQDIITAVSGILILVTLILATDLEKPLQSRSENADPKLEQQLQEILRQQLEADAQNSRLQQLLAAAEAAPALEKLEADVSRLRSQLSDEQNKQTSIADQMTANQKATEARDKILGLSDLKATIQHTIQEAESIAQKDAKVRSEMDGQEQEVARAQYRLLKLRQREGQLWLIPDKSTTTKEPILVTVSGSGAIIERFDHPDQRRELDAANADSEFESYLNKSKPLDQYVVFLIRPSGIALFQELLKSARDKGFDVGFDALEENKQIHFSTPPPVDEPTPPTNKTSAASDQSAQNTPSTTNSSNGSQTNSSSRATSHAPAKSQPAMSPAPPRTKSWWQRFLEFVGLG
jgi:hypothetical protein